jgi:hypothetical protein
MVSVRSNDSSGGAAAAVAGPTVTLPKASSTPPMEASQQTVVDERKAKLRATLTKYADKRHPVSYPLLSHHTVIIMLHRSSHIYVLSYMYHVGMVIW